MSNIDLLRMHDKQMSNLLRSIERAEYDLLEIIDFFCEQTNNPYAYKYAGIILEEAASSREILGGLIVECFQSLQALGEQLNAPPSPPSQ